METENVCFTCSSNQVCCRDFSRLRLSQSEFNKDFSGHRDSLHIEEYLGIYEVTSQPNSCPNWNGKQCTIYETRPVECRLYPYTIEGVLKIRRLVLLSYHYRTRCPHKNGLLLTHAEVLELLMTFAEEAFGNSLRVVIVPDNFPIRVARFLISLPYKIIYGLRNGAKGIVG